ncbi:DUF2142 domain-containing protein [Sphingobium agri]|uniref:DUF2142 domain-containing protein n=1 Tax=Sphingobium agri TaxID=2933566 RepID=A0ABT0DVW2_9SPHN|nr:DUF2142 domain-containing protein [Sphingobium agri]MCK0531264.1 DUF2142 domain-containing protein [Sphingobium agri]
MRHERLSISTGRAVLSPIAVPVTGLERWLLALVCTVTLAFAIITPPFQAPDENQHYMKALLLADGRVMTEQRGPEIGAELPRSALELHGVDFPTEVTGKARRFDPAMVERAWSADAGRPGTAFADFPNVANYAPTLYAPSAAGLMIGDAVGLPRIGSFYVGRLVNAAGGLILLTVAFGLMPFGRAALLATALLPTFCYQTGSLSPDAVINSIGFAGLALSLRLAAMGSSPARNAGLMLAAPLLALAKGVYLPLMAAGLQWPQHRRDMRPWLLIGAMAVGAAAFILWMNMSGGSQALYHIVSRKTGEDVMTAPLAAQLGVILADPAAYVRALGSSIVERSPVYALQIAGRFGWNAILLPLLAYPVAAVMLAAAVASGSGVRVSLAQRLWWLAVLVGTGLLIETAMYLTGTPLGADYVQGTQGRYFLPLLPLALLALMPETGLRGARGVFAGSALLLLMIALASAYDSFWVHGFVTADGMPPHERLSDALLLPSPRW